MSQRYGVSVSHPWKLQGTAPAGGMTSIASRNDKSDGPCYRRDRMICRNRSKETGGLSFISDETTPFNPASLKILAGP